MYEQELYERFCDPGKSVHTKHANAVVRAFIDPQSPPPPTFKYRLVDWIDTPENRTHCGFKKLSAKYYPDEQGWLEFTVYDSAAKDYLSIKGEWYKRADMVAVLRVHQESDEKDRHYPEYHSYGSPNPELVNQRITSTWMHKSEIDAANFFKVSSLKRTDHTLAHKDVKAVKTDSGRTMIPGYHSIVQTYDGVWMMASKARQMAQFNISYWTPNTRRYGLSLDEMMEVPWYVPKLKESVARHGSMIQLYEDRSSGDARVERTIWMAVKEQLSMTRFHRDAMEQYAYLPSSATRNNLFMAEELGYMQRALHEGPVHPNMIAYAAAARLHIELYRYLRGLVFVKAQETPLPELPFGMSHPRKTIDTSYDGSPDVVENYVPPPATSLEALAQMAMPVPVPTSITIAQRIDEMARIIQNQPMGDTLILRPATVNVDLEAFEPEED
jgi:hypothetical protein